MQPQKRGVQPLVNQTGSSGDQPFDRYKLGDVTEGIVWTIRQDRSSLRWNQLTWVVRKAHLGGPGMQYPRRVEGREGFTQRTVAGYPTHTDPPWGNPQKPPPRTSAELPPPPDPLLLTLLLLPLLILSLLLLLPPVPLPCHCCTEVLASSVQYAKASVPLRGSTCEKQKSASAGSGVRT